MNGITLRQQFAAEKHHRYVSLTKGISPKVCHYEHPKSMGMVVLPVYSQNWRAPQSPHQRQAYQSRLNAAPQLDDVSGFEHPNVGWFILNLTLW